MEANVVEKTKSANAGLETVRAKAKRQGQVKFSKPANPGERDLVARSSLQKIKTLKSKACEESYDEDELAPQLNVFASAWDWFQRAIGNR